MGHSNIYKTITTAALGGVVLYCKHETLLINNSNSLAVETDSYFMYKNNYISDVDGAMT